MPDVYRDSSLVPQSIRVYIEQWRYFRESGSPGMDVQNVRGWGCTIPTNTHVRLAYRKIITTVTLGSLLYSYLAHHPSVNFDPRRMWEIVGVQDHTVTAGCSALSLVLGV